MVKRRAVWTLLGLGWMLGCDVPAAAVGTGGVHFDSGTAAEDGAVGSHCARGLVVVNSDFLSTTVSILGADATLLSETFISSASGSLGLSEPLGGDVMIPTMPVIGNEVVLLDNTTSVVTWVELESAEVTGQLRIGTTDFFAYPHDYAQLAADRAYVTRFGVNNAPGREPLDAGNDIAIIDPRRQRLLGTISLDPAVEGVDPKYLARPDKMVRVGDYVYILLNMLTKTYPYQATNGRLAMVDARADEVVGVLTLPGLVQCAGLALSPDQSQLAITCSGTFGGDSYSTLEGSGVVLVDIDGPLGSERRRWEATHFEAGPLGFFVSFASQDLVAVTTFPREGGGAAVNKDALLTLELPTGAVEVLFEAATEFTLGHVRCLPGCGLCLLADADRRGGMLHRFKLDAGRLRPDGRAEIDKTTGLPPWAIGVLD